MNASKLSNKQLSNLAESLLQIVKTSDNKERGSESEESNIHRIFSLASSSGKQLYKSLSEEELLRVLVDIARELGHSPSQKEVFWIWREYIKLRFKKWPYALTAAGLAKSAGKGGKTLEQVQEDKSRYDLMIYKIREKAKSLGRTPHPKDLPEVYSELDKTMYTWQEAIREAALDQDFFVKNSLYLIEDLEEEYNQYLQETINQANLLGRVPQRNEIDISITEKLISRCGTWRNSLYQIGLEPVTRITPFSSTSNEFRQVTRKRSHRNTIYDCYYKVLNLNLQSKRDLMELRKIAEKLQHVPHKNEVPEEVRLRLQKVCGSWANAVYQLKFIENDMI